LRRRKRNFARIYGMNGIRRKKGGGHNRVAVDGIVGESTQGSLARSATLGWRAQSLWDWANESARDGCSTWFMVPMHARIRKRAFHELDLQECLENKVILNQSFTTIRNLDKIPPPHLGGGVNFRRY
jgi:hypothetical protein